MTARPDEQIQRKFAELRKEARLLGDKSKPRLSQLGLWNALSEVISPGALARIRDNGTFYHLVPRIQAPWSGESSGCAKHP